MDLDAIRRRLMERRITDADEIPDTVMIWWEDHGVLFRLDDGQWALLVIESGYERGDEEIVVETGAIDLDRPPHEFVELGVLSEEEYDALYADYRQRREEKSRREAAAQAARQQADERALYERLRQKYEVGR